MELITGNIVDKPFLNSQIIEIVVKFLEIHQLSNIMSMC